MSKRTTISLPPEFQRLCASLNVRPQDVLDGFIRDLCELPGSHGSDEREMAERYLDRCGYGRW